MTAFTEAQKVSIRKYLGFPALFHQQIPQLENAINAIQAVADGGVLPTNDTQLSVLASISAIADIEAKITGLYCSFQVLEASDPKVRLDAIRAAFYLKSEGRRLIQQLCIPLGTRVFKDYFSPSDPNDNMSGDSVFMTDLG